MADRQTKERVRELRRLIVEHRRAYYDRDAPTVSDEEFDDLFQELVDLETAHPELSDPNSPTQSPGVTPSSTFESVPHLQPMLSLSNVYDHAGLKDFVARVQRALPNDDICYVVEPKLDGLALSLLYENGELVRAATRGDGFIGENVTANARMVKNIPKVLASGGMPAPLARIEVRGEIVIRKKDFSLLNNEREGSGETPFANPRNAAAGSLRQINPSITRSRPLLFFAHSYAVDEDATPFERHSAFLLAATGWGFAADPLTQTLTTTEEIAVYHARLEADRDALDIDIDGVVVKVDSTNQQATLGSIARSPRWAIAYKFKAHQARTRLLSIATQVGRHGTLTPVAILEPVPLGGVTVSRASLHNLDEIQRKDIRAGDLVLIERAGDVIPYVVTPTLKARPSDAKKFELSEECPSCRSPIERVEDESAFRCINLHCTARFKESLRYFASKQAMDIDGFGEAIISPLVDEGIVKTFADIYRLDLATLANIERTPERLGGQVGVTQSKQDPSTRPRKAIRVGMKTAQKLVNSIQASREKSLGRVIIALGIRHVGETIARTLARKFGSLGRLLEFDSANPTDLAGEGVGSEISASVQQYFKDPINRAMVADLAKELSPTTAASTTGGALTGKIFVLTGALSITRSHAKERVEAAGGTLASSVSAKVDYLVVGADPGSKLANAEKLGVAIIDESELMRLLDSSVEKGIARARSIRERAPATDQFEQLNLLDRTTTTTAPILVHDNMTSRGKGRA